MTTSSIQHHKLKLYKKWPGSWVTFVSCFTEKRSSRIHTNNFTFNITLRGLVDYKKLQPRKYIIHHITLYMAKCMIQRTVTWIVCSVDFILFHCNDKVILITVFRVKSPQSGMLNWRLFVKQIVMFLISSHRLQRKKIF